MAKNLKVMFDIDGVLADFVLGFTDRACLKYGTPAERTVEHKVWDLFPGLDKKMIDAIWRDLEKDDSHFWDSLEKLPSLVEEQYLWHLCGRDGVEVYFVTNRHTRTAHDQTQRWLATTFGIPGANVICVGAQSKGNMAKALEADFAIDDKLGNAVYMYYESPKTKVYLLERPYNAVGPEMIGRGVVRVPTLTPFLADIEDEWQRRQK